MNHENDLDENGEASEPAGRSIELEIEVPGTPEEVWRAIATGPGISSWYVPHEVEEREGGAASASFGPDPEMTVPGRVAAWDPPRRVLFDGGEDVEGLAFEWLIEAKQGGSCIVRLINSGFGLGGEWDDHYDAMTEGWKMFLANLRLHLQHFGGDSASASLPTASWPEPPELAWSRLVNRLGIGDSVELGDHVTLTLSGGGEAELAGEVVAVEPTRISMVVAKPLPGTAFLAAEPRGDDSSSEMSIWAYFYGDGREEQADRWYRMASSWLADVAPAEG